MVNEEKIYIILCVVFSVLIVTGNLVYQKFVSLPVPPFHTFELSVGAILYPLTFLVTDLITEFYGKEKANFCVRMGIIMNILVAIMIGGMDHLNATPWSKISNEVFHSVFGLYGVAFVGSIFACYISQHIDIMIYLKIRKITGEKWLWLRNNGSTAFSLFIDTTIVISFMAMFGAVPIDFMGKLIINSYLFKLFFTIFSTPLFYLCAYIIRWGGSSSCFARESLKKREIMSY